MATKHVVARAVIAGALGITMVGLAALRSDATPPYGATISAQQAKLVAGDGAAFDNFGGAVAVSGNTAIVGAAYDDGTAGEDQGSAHVWIRNGASWASQAKLVANDAAASDSFGTSVAISGDTAVVGAAYDDGTGGFDQGSAYVFIRTGTAWTQQAKLVASDAALSDLFGQSVAISGNTVVVGADGDDAPGTNPDRFDRGSAYVFTRSGTTWTQQAKLVADDAAQNDWLGRSVALSGDTAVIGRDFVGGTDEGSAYVFTRAGTTWTQQTKLLPTDPANGDRFGWSVAVVGDTALVSAPRDDGAATNQGSVYAFTRTDSTWTQQTKLLPTDPGAFDGFGWSLAYADGTAVIGALFDTTNDVETGSAYVFAQNGASWTQQSKLLGSDTAEFDSFGQAVAVSADTVLVGAFADDGGGGTDQGSAYVFVPGAFSISDATLQEGTGGTSSMTFTVTRTGALSNAAYVEVSTAGGTALSGVDFDPTATTLSFLPGAASQLFTVAVETDSLNEPDESFGVALSNPSGALIGDGGGRGTIVDDDDPSTLSIAAPAAAVTETDASNVAATFTVTRGGSSGGPVSVEVHTNDGTAKAADDDYTPTARTLRWADGETGAKNFTVQVEPDNITESVERFFASLSRAVGADIDTGFARATINDDDAPTVSISVNDPTIIEADSGTKNIVFKITRTGPTTNAIAFNFATANGTAVAPGDYTARTGSATIPAGATFVNVTVVTKGDVINENNETFTLTISGASGGATISDAVGTGTITDND